MGVNTGGPNGLQLGDAKGLVKKGIGYASLYNKKQEAKLLFPN